MRVVLLLLIVLAQSSLLWSGEAVSPTPPAADHRKEDQLLAVLAEASPTFPPSDLDRERRRAEIVREHDARRKAALSELTGMGDSIVEYLVERTERAEDPQSKKEMMETAAALKVLGNLGTEKAQNALLAIVSARKNTMLATCAASVYAGSVKDPSKCRMFFLSQDKDIADVGFRKIRGVAMDPEVLAKLRPYLHSQQRDTRRQAINIVMADTSENIPVEKTQALIESLLGIGDIPDVQYKINWGFEHMNRGVEEDEYHGLYADALWRVKGKGAAEEIQRQAGALESGLARTCLFAALGLRGDIAAAREPLRLFLMDPAFGTRVQLRLRSLEAFRGHGEPRDIEFLQGIAENDLYYLETYYYCGPLPLEKWGDKFINLTKEAAAKPEDHLFPLNPLFPEADRKVVSGKDYVIRRTAKGAIAAIRARQNSK